MTRELTRNEWETVPYDEDDIRTSHMDTYEEETRPRYYIQPTDPSDYDENWVNGFECSDLFKEFTIYERRILKWYYEAKAVTYEDLDKHLIQLRKELWKKTEDDIADLLGCSRKTVNVKRNETKRKLYELAKELHLLKDNQSLSHI
jgi:DNA-binding XRE family transcriptional regulator